MSDTLVQDKSLEIEFFDQWAESKAFQQFGHFTDTGHDTLIQHFNKYVRDKLTKGHNVIDLGCGSGAFTRRFFKDAQAACFGQDISPGVIRAAKELDQKTVYLVGDVENTSFGDETFDVIVCGGVLHHVPNKEKMLKEIRRILKKGGYFLSYDPNLSNPFMWFYKDFWAKLSSKLLQTKNEQLFTVNQIQDVLGKEGFSKIDIECLSRVPFKYVGSRLGEYLLPVYNFIDHLLDKSFLRRKYGAMIVVCAQK